MKIQCQPRSGSLTLAVVFVVACVVVVTIGGCAVHKLQKKIDEKNKRAATNDVEQFSAQLLQEARATDPSAFTLAMMQIATQEVGQVIIWRLDTSTNLNDWETLLETADPGEADSVVVRAFAAPTSDARFFRMISR